MKRFFALLLALCLLTTAASAAEISPDELLTKVGDYSQYGTGDMTPYDDPVEVSLGISINLSRAFPEGDG